MSRIISINVSVTKGVRKQPVATARIGAEGIEGDAHAGPWHRMVSLLAEESIDKMRAAGLEVGPGDFAENLTTRGLDLLALPLGTRLRIGEEAVLEVSQHGKECHTRCAIYYQAGDCVMPKEGIFASVVAGGRIATGDRVEPLLPAGGGKGNRNRGEDGA
jgi:MOSC domain-containing protein YiiM